MSNAISKRRKRKSGRPAARIAQSHDDPHAGFASGRAEAIGQKLVELAENVDIAAIRICMDRLAPAGKDEPVDVGLPPIEKPADSVAAAQAIVAAVAAGDLTAAEAAGLAKVVDVYVRAVETKGFDERLTKLENRPPRLPLNQNNGI